MWPLCLQPFRFPATFTFVVRSFTVLDGIGKGLNPRFDISEIAAPYARRYTSVQTQCTTFLSWDPLDFMLLAPRYMMESLPLPGIG